MAVVNAKKCDLCGYVYEETDGYEDELVVSINQVTCYDMCPRCHHKIMDTIGFLKQPKRTTKKTNFDDRFMSREEFDALRRA